VDVGHVDVGDLDEREPPRIVSSLAGRAGTMEGARRLVRPLLRLPTRARPLLYAVSALAVALIVGLGTRLDDSLQAWPEFALLAGAAAAAQLLIVPTGRNHGFHTALVFIVAAVLLLPPELVALLGIAQHVPAWIRNRYPAYIGVFNVANYTVAALAAWAAAHLVHSGDPDGNASFAAAGAVAALTFVAVNHLLLSSMLLLARGHTFRESGLFAVRPLGIDLGLGALGVALAALWELNPWLVPAVVAPLLLTHRSFSNLAAARESEGRFRAMFESAPIGAALISLEGRVMGANLALQRMLGYDEEELAERSIGEITHPEDVDTDFELLAELVEGKRDRYEIEKRYHAKDGRLVWGRLAVSLVRDADARPKFALGMVEDTTERRRADEAMRESEKRYRELFENANDMVFTLDLEGRITAINRAGERITGYPREELLGRPVTDLLAAGAEEWQLETQLQESAIEAKDGRRIPVELASRLIEDASGPIGVQGIARDVSDRRELEDQLRQAQKMEAVGQLAGGVAHDFNNLLTAIMGYGEVALAHADSPTPDGKLRDAVQQIGLAADRASALTRQLLAFSRKQILQPEVVRLDALVSEVDPMLRRLIGEDVEIATLYGAGLGRVKADPGQISQVLMNLVVNARDAMPSGGKLTIETANADVDEAAARVTGGQPGQYVVLSVSDTGEGMDEEVKSRLFEPFFTTKEQGKGTGLGLAMTYGIVKQSGGFITVDSEPGRGAAFRIYLPRLDAAEDEAAEPDAEPGGVVEGSETVLLVEDEDIVRNLVAEILATAGYTVLGAADGMQALEVAERHPGPIHLLLTDVVMPKMSGRDLAERLVSLHGETKVLYTSGYTDSAIVDRGVLQPGTEFIQKPFSFAALTQKVRDVLDA
jgi:two-component system, cell cycle sensor histidine kinase and response regulator CckA